ncbi:MOP flippase family protein [Pantoea phytobeneficialis]|uniref:Colanic acid exporter n=1 Tax=Pantoea phytobeneficialis TaxID=2052056 RepID=A0AAP9HAG3_9GAMM|nr:MOP flippase family protein [Pantoea phytobeneficialis]MDO6407403.1 MOP flippase family protein [Pantoea phytobeneficialis]QGR09547.1 colanic acid exporter [Pantoea phytobeneficialis]
MSLKDKTVKSTKWSAVSSLTVIVFGFAQVTVLSHILSTYAFGVASILSIVLLMTDMLADCGISNSIIQKKDINRKELSTLYWLNTMLGVCLFCVFWLLSGLIAILVKVPDVEGLIKLTSIAFLILPHGQQYRALIQKELNFNFLAKVESFSYVFGFLVAIVTASFTKDASSVVIGYLANITLRTVLLSKWGAVNFSPSRHFNIKGIKDNILFAFYLTSDSLLNYVTLSAVTPIISRLIGAILAGGYNLAYSVTVNPPSKISPVITRVMFPALAKMQDEPERLKKNFFKMLHFIGHVNFPFLLVLFFLSEDFIQIFFGDKWEFINHAFKILCICGALRIVANPLGALLMAKARMDLSLKFNVLKIFLFLPIIYCSVLYFGFMGAAFGFLICQLINLVGSYVFLVRPVLGHCLKDFISSIVMPLLHLLPMGMVLYVLNQSNFLGQVGYYELAIKLSSAFVVYLLTYFLSKDLVVNEIRAMAFGSLLKKRSSPLKG